MDEATKFSSRSLISRHPSCADVLEQRPAGVKKPRRRRVRLDAKAASPGLAYGISNLGYPTPSGQSPSIRSCLCYLNAPQKTVFTSVL